MPPREPRPVAPAGPTAAMPGVAKGAGKGRSAARPRRRLPNGCRGYNHLEGLLQIANQIRLVLDTDREAQQGVLDLGLGPRDTGVRHLPGVLDQRLHAPEADGELED